MLCVFFFSNQTKYIVFQYRKHISKSIIKAIFLTMAKQNDCNRNSVTAVFDIGTTYCGIAFSFRTRSYEICFRKWTNGRLVSPKTPTCILLNSENDCIVFGYETEAKFSDLVENKNIQTGFYSGASKRFYTVTRYYQN